MYRWLFFIVSAFLVVQATLLILRYIHVAVCCICNVFASTFLVRIATHPVGCFAGGAFTFC